MRQIAAIAEPVYGRIGHAEVLCDLGDLERPTRPPQSTLRSASAGATLARCGAFGAEGAADRRSVLGHRAPLPTGPDPGTKWVTKFFVKPVDNCESLDCEAMSVCNESAELVTPASCDDVPFPIRDPKVGRSNPIVKAPRGESMPT